MSTTQLTRFTPSLMPADLLERLFVERGPLLDRIMARVNEAATSSGRNHTLLVGPRGAGKTHLVALAYHRTKALMASGAALQVAWLPEDPWTITTYPRLLRAILERLEPADDARQLPGDIEKLEALIVSRAASGPIIVLLENLDRVLASIGDRGQQRLRHLLQHRRPLLLIASTTQLDRDLSDQARPFYEFFTTTRLEPFSPEVAAEMLCAIALENGDLRVAEYLASDEGRSRLRVVEHLAGGQPRLWSIFADAMSESGLRELVSFLVRRFDDLTPYYQEQVGRLSAQQRLVVAELALADRPLHVAGIAELVEVDQRSVGKTMGELVDRGWVRETDSPAVRFLDRRRTYYELAEPLARIIFQMKDARDGAAIRLVVDFLKGWFAPERPSEATEADDPYVALARSEIATDPALHVARMLRRLPASRVPAVELLGEIDDALAALARGDADTFLGLPAPVRSALESRLGRISYSGDIFDVRMIIHGEAVIEFGNVPHPGRREWIARAEDLVASPDPVFHRDLVWPAQLRLVTWLAGAWQFDNARVLLEAARAAGAPDSATLHGLNDIVDGYRAAGLLHLAIADLKLIVAERERILGSEHPHTLGSRNRLADAYLSAGDLGRAISLHLQTLAASERVLGLDDPRTATARNNLASAYRAAGRLSDAIRLFDQVVTDRERIFGPEHPHTLGSRNNLAGAYLADGRFSEAIATFDHVVTERERILGPDHPDTLGSLNNLASALQAAGQLASAIPLFERVITESERVLGADHPDTLSSRNNLASAYLAADRPSDAIPIFQQTLADSERVLGSEHPLTASVRTRLAQARAAC